MNKLDVRTAYRRGWHVGIVLMVCAGAAQANAQETTRRVTGRVVEADGKAPVPAAQVHVTNTTVGITTSDSGTFAFRVPTGPATLTVRRIGYRSATVPLAADQNDITIEVTRDVLKLDVEVITGVATTIASKNSANAVAVVTADQIGGVPAPTIENALQGKIPGAMIAQNNGGAPGGGMQVMIRGITSINSNASPLYVIDGVLIDNETVNSGANAVTGSSTNALVPVNQDNSANRIADINPNDIETIEVLKGASAAAIYGSKAASGVIVITTKKGNPGAPQWDVSGQAGTYLKANTLSLRTFPTYASANAWYKNDFGSPTDLPPAMYAGPQDYQQQFFGGGQLSGQGDLSVRGATPSTNYFASAHDQYDNGIMLGTSYNKQAIRTNITQSFSSNLQVSANLYYQHSVASRGITGNDNVGISPYNVFSQTPQFFNLNQFANGSWVTNPFAFANPFADAAEIQTPTTVSRFIGGGTVNWVMLHTNAQDLHLSLVTGVDLAGQQDINYSPPTLQVEQNKGLVGTSNINQANLEYYNYSLSLIHHFAGVSFLDATTSIGISQDRRKLDNPDIVGQDLPIGITSPTSGKVQNAFRNQTDTKSMSLYAQEQVITLAQRLTLTAGVTADRNSNNGNFSAYYLYPKFSGSYRIPQFVGFIDEVKLRAAFGRSGNFPIYGYNYPDNASCTPVLNGNHAFVCGYLPTIPVFFNANDTKIRPETSTEIESGVDITMFGSRAQLTATIYNKRISDLLLFAAPPASSGLGQVVLNGGAFTNQGLELSLQASPFSNPRGFTWISNTTFFRNYSRVDQLPIPAFITTYGFGGAFGTNIIQPGRSVTQIVNTSKLGPDGQAVQVGDATPGAVVSINQAVSFRNFHLSGVLDWSIGGNVSNLTNAYYDGPRFLLADSAASAKRIADAGAGGTPYVESATFAKLREIRFSIDLPTQWVRKIGAGRLRSARLDLSGRNLWMSTKYSGLDPEVSVFGNLAVGRGQDITPYPPAKSFFVGVNLGL